MKVALMEANPQMIASGSTLLLTIGNPQILTTGSPQMNEAQILKQEKMDVSISDSKRTVLAAENGAMTSVSKLVVSGLLRMRHTETPEGSTAQTIQTTPMELATEWHATKNSSLRVMEVRIVTPLVDHMVVSSIQKIGHATGLAQLVSSKDALKNGAFIATTVAKMDQKNATFGVSQLEDITKWYNMSTANMKSVSGTTSTLLSSSRKTCEH